MPVAALAPEPDLIQPLGLRRRSERVWMLVSLIAAASLIDLHLTIVHLQGVGMIEANPLARWVMDAGCAWVLTLWKVASVGLALGIYLRHRHRALTEAAAWISAGIMIWLMLQWIGYSQHVGELTPVLHKIAHAEHVPWVTMSAN
jgi:hypothetical protein